MEHQRQKKLEKEAKDAARRERSSRPTWRDELDEEEEKEEGGERRRTSRSYRYSHSKSPSTTKVCILYTDDVHGVVSMPSPRPILDCFQYMYMCCKPSVQPLRCCIHCTIPRPQQIVLLCRSCVESTRTKTVGGLVPAKLLVAKTTQQVVYTLVGLLLKGARNFLIMPRSCGTSLTLNPSFLSKILSHSFGEKSDKVVWLNLEWESLIGLEAMIDFVPPAPGRARMRRSVPLHVTGGDTWWSNR